MTDTETKDEKPLVEAAAPPQQPEQQPEGEETKKHRRSSSSRHRSASRESRGEGGSEDDAARKKRKKHHKAPSTGDDKEAPKDTVPEPQSETPKEEKKDEKETPKEKEEKTTEDTESGTERLPVHQRQPTPTNLGLDQATLAAVAAPAPTAARDAVALPPGWEERVDPATGRKYYVDHNTKTTTWRCPVADDDGGDLSPQLPEPKVVAQQYLQQGPPAGKRGCLKTAARAHPTAATPTAGAGTTGTGAGAGAGPGACGSGSGSAAGSSCGSVSDGDADDGSGDEGVSVVGEFMMDVLLALHTAVNMSYALFIPDPSSSATAASCREVLTATAVLRAALEEEAAQEARAAQRRKKGATGATEDEEKKDEDGEKKEKEKEEEEEEEKRKEKEEEEDDERPLNKEEEELRMFHVTHSHRVSRPGSKMNMVVKDYAPDAFEVLRRMYGLDHKNYLRMWLAPKMPTRTTDKSTMLYSEDGRLILKVLTHAEAKTLFALLPDYSRHLCDHPETTLVKYFGLHRLTRGHDEYYFTVFSNVFDPRVRMLEVYDLKGSSAGRQVIVPNRPILRRQAAVLKDLDFNRKVWLATATRRRLLHQLRADTAFLERHRLMDYSLLVGIAGRVPPPQPQQQQPQVRTTTAAAAAVVAAATAAVVPSPKQAAVVGAQTVPSSSSVGGEDEGVGATPPTPRPLSVQPPHRRRSFLCFVEETFDPQLQNVPRRLSSVASPRTQKVSPLQPAQQPSQQQQQQAPAPAQQQTQGPQGPAGREVAGESRALSFWATLPSSDPAGCVEETYYLGVIDFLTVYGTGKKLSGFFQSVRHGRESVSTVSPEFYARRFLQMAAADVAAPDAADAASDDGTASTTSGTAGAGDADDAGLDDTDDQPL